TLAAWRRHRLRGDASPQPARCGGTELSAYSAGVSARGCGALREGGVLIGFRRALPLLRWHRALLMRTADLGGFRIVAGDHSHALVQSRDDVGRRAALQKRDVI